MLHDIKCNCCSGEAVDVVFDAGEAQVHRIVKCRRCGLMFASPRALEHEHQNEDPNQNLRSGAHTRQRIEKERLQIADYAETKSFLGSLYPRRGRLLEIGSGYGYLLADFRNDGWSVMGVDPFAAACEHARTKLGVEVINSVLEEAGIEDATFDVVVMNHVIEHMPDPSRSLAEVRRVLKPKGHLVIETPRYDTLMFKILGRRERSISCDGHIYFFTKTSLENVCRAAGFEPVKFSATGRTLTLERLMWNIGVLSKSRPVRNWLGSVSRRLGFHRIGIHLNARDIQRVCLQKA